jgi:hypothetical protein
VSARRSCGNEFGTQSAHGVRSAGGIVLGEGGGKPPHPKGWGCGCEGGEAMPKEAMAG